jgi:uncharacterized membrane protein
MVVLPEETSIVSLNTIPESIKTLDGKTVLLMPQGRVEVSYTVSLKGTREYAQTAILDAREAISKAKAEGRTLGIREAEEKLKEAEKAFVKANYSDASKLAEEAKRLAEQAVKPKPPTQPTVLPSPATTGIIIAVVVAGALVAFMLKRRVKTHITTTPSSFSGLGKVEVDLEKVCRNNPGLRFEDREALKFLAEKGGAAFESEIREKLNLPRTSTWRLIKRLEKHGIVTVHKVAGQNLVKVSESYLKK